jgi:hypothetical protein
MQDNRGENLSGNSAHVAQSPAFADPLRLFSDKLPRWVFQISLSIMLKLPTSQMAVTVSDFTHLR